MFTAIAPNGDRVIPRVRPRRSTRGGVTSRSSQSSRFASLGAATGVIRDTGAGAALRVGRGIFDCVLGGVTYDDAAADASLAACITRAYCGMFRSRSIASSGTGASARFNPRVLGISATGVATGVVPVLYLARRSSRFSGLGPFDAGLGVSALSALSSSSHRPTFRKSLSLVSASRRASPAATALRRHSLSAPRPILCVSASHAACASRSRRSSRAPASSFHAIQPFLIDDSRR
mmetsp:Transcript_11763/g.54744  ORF Transcript_11763/g.54744 Transcript_11763/m.54744 type:complete len:234 (-) Transcript_11763:2803-3504(-)